MLNLAFSVGLSCGMGDRARYPLKFRPDVLITIAIVVAVLRKMKTQSTSTTAFSRSRPYP